MIYSLCKYLFNKLTHVELQWFYNHPLVQSYVESRLAILTSNLDNITVSDTVSSPVPVPPVQTEVFARMEQDTYDYLERQLSNNLVVSSTTELEAGFKLGVAHVLQKLRAGYVIQRG